MHELHLGNHSNTWLKMTLHLYFTIQKNGICNFNLKHELLSKNMSIKPIVYCVSLRLTQQRISITQHITLNQHHTVGNQPHHQSV